MFTCTLTGYAFFLWTEQCLKNADIFLKENHKAVIGAASSDLILKLDNKPP